MIKEYRKDISFSLAGINHAKVILEMMRAFNAIDDYPFDEEVVEQSLYKFLTNQELGRLYLIHNGKECIGYVVLAFGFSFEYQGRDAFIDELFVAAPFRNQGIGTAAMAYVSKEAEKYGVKAIHLEVEKHNKSARKLYKSAGFQSNDRGLMTKRLF